MKIRQATPKDKNAWAQLRNALWPDTIEAHENDIECFIAGNSPHIAACFTLEDQDGTLGGFIELNIRSYAEGIYHSMAPYVEGWYIEPQFRRQGFGKQLIAHAEHWAKSQGFDRLASDAEITNQNSIEAHKALGFDEVERIVCFVKRI